LWRKTANLGERSVSRSTASIHTLCGTWAMLHARSRERIRKNGKIGDFGARAEAEGLDCRARRSWRDRQVGQPRRRGLSNLWYGAQFPPRLICPAASGLAGARDVGLDLGHAKGRRLAPGATLHMSQNGMWASGMPRRGSARVPHRVKQSLIKGTRQSNGARDKRCVGIFDVFPSYAREARRAWRAPASGGRQNHTYVLMLVVQRTATMRPTRIGCRSAWKAIKPRSDVESLQELAHPSKQHTGPVSGPFQVGLCLAPDPGAAASRLSL
jgi:hypothetical protein